MKIRYLLPLLLLASCAQCEEERPGEPWSFSEPIPLPEEVPPPDESCDTIAPPPCQGHCVIDVEGRRTDCNFDVDWEQSRFTLEMPSPNARVHLRAQICDPSGWTLHVGDSPSNDGFGGDAAEFSNDAELQIVDTQITVYGSDLSVDEPGHTREYPDAIAPSGCSVVDTVIGDSQLSLMPVCVEEQSDDLFRLDAPDAEGRPDRLWYVGMNRTYRAPGRNGSGLRYLQVCVVIN